MSELKYTEKRANLDLDMWKLVQLMRNEGLYDLYHMAYVEHLNHITILIYTPEPGENRKQRKTHAEMSKFTSAWGDARRTAEIRFDYTTLDGCFYDRNYQKILDSFRKHKMMLLT